MSATGAKPLLARLSGAAMPLLRRLPPETAHRLTLQLLSAGMHPRRASPDPPLLAVELWGRHFANPLGLAAGFDKDASVPDAMLGWGFGFVEIGTVTPLPQQGNPRPRLFRLASAGAVLNRMGFNNLGVEHARRRLAARDRNGLVGANVGKNKETVDAASDFCIGVRALAPHADYVVVNISSPNTPGLRDLQRREEAQALLAAVMTARASVGGATPPLLVKLSPDLSERELEELVEVALAAGVDGLIVSNTTIARPASLGARWRSEPGGLSGRPLFAASTRLLAETYRLTHGRLPLIGVGGIGSGADAYAKILAGASLVQLYTALVYRGPGLVARIKAELAECLTRDGFASVREAVGQGGGGG